jgi:hypothetical protein
MRLRDSFRPPRQYSGPSTLAAIHPLWNRPLVELGEGPRLLSNVVGVEPQRIRCGMRVVVKFEDRSPEISVPKFSPAEAEI